MRLFDGGAMSFTAIVRYPLRSAMLLVAISIGVAAVLLLTSLGEGARRYVTSQFNNLGSHLLIVTPGKNEAVGLGAVAGALGEPPRPLTLEDAMAIDRSPHIESVTLFVAGQATVNYNGVERQIDVLGATANMQGIFDIEVGKGRFLPEVDLDNIAPLAVIGDTIARELFANAQPVGKWIRIGDRRVRVIGVAAQQGRVGSMDVDDGVFVPTGFAMQMFNQDSIQKMMVQAHSADDMHQAREDIINTVRRRHQGHDDVTVLDQGAILSTFNAVATVLTSVLTAIASISLVVAGTLIMNVMLVAVSQRTQEIGLIKALGGTRRQIIRLFLAEAALLSLFGAALGVVVGQLGIQLMRTLYPLVDFHAPSWAVVAAVMMALAAGLLFGILPARRAASLDPVQALSGR